MKENLVQLFSKQSNDDCYRFTIFKYHYRDNKIFLQAKIIEILITIIFNYQMNVFDSLYYVIVIRSLICHYLILLLYLLLHFYESITNLFILYFISYHFYLIYFYLHPLFPFNLYLLQLSFLNSIFINLHYLFFLNTFATFSLIYEAINLYFYLCMVLYQLIC